MFDLLFAHKDINCRTGKFKNLRLLTNYKIEKAKIYE